jgi:hypothetical protein
MPAPRQLGVVAAMPAPGRSADRAPRNGVLMASAEDGDRSQQCPGTAGRRTTMDAARFDRLSRALTPGQTRRRFFGHVGGGFLFLAPLAAGNDAAAKKKRRKKKGKHKKRQQCSPACTGAKDCKNGVCVCPSGTEECDGECLNVCGVDRARNPHTCNCCKVNGVGPCGFSGAECCSDFCFPHATGWCVGFGAGDACTFDAQCASGNCNGFCGT